MSTRCSSSWGGEDVPCRLESDSDPESYTAAGAACETITLEQPASGGHCELLLTLPAQRAWLSVTVESSARSLEVHGARGARFEYLGSCRGVVSEESQLYQCALDSAEHDDATQTLRLRLLSLRVPGRCDLRSFVVTTRHRAAAAEPAPSAATPLALLGLLRGLGSLGGPAPAPHRAAAAVGERLAALEASMPQAEPAGEALQSPSLLVRVAALESRLDALTQSVERRLAALEQRLFVSEA